jgi:3-deoxy-manno-octulosonate cytidylyltransferase (CMP-KDO synthetase)
MSVIGIIPARYASTRFPGKPLADINGRSMLRRVYEQAMLAQSLDEVIVATDDARIEQHAASFGAKTVLTNSEHPSGTDRCYEAYMAHGKKYDYVVNIQGDEPFIDPEQINELARACDGHAEIVTQMIRCTTTDVLFDKGEVKIVLNDKKEALYFSRNVIPYQKNVAESEWHKHFDYFRHVGMYAYRTDILERICHLKVSSLEKAESLEQLRWLENGYRIRCVETNYDSHCVDTPDDIGKVLRLMNIK